MKASSYAKLKELFLFLRRRGYALRIIVKINNKKDIEGYLISVDGYGKFTVLTDDLRFLRFSYQRVQSIFIPQEDNIKVYKFVEQILKHYDKGPYSSSTWSVYVSSNDNRHKVGHTI